MEKVNDVVRRPYSSLDDVKGEVFIDGSFMGHSLEKRVWKDKATGQEKTLDVDCAFLQNDRVGIVVVRCFNPTFDFNTLKMGDKCYFPIEKYEKENGLRAFSIRV